MENVTAYDIAIIGGGFTVVGALISAVVAYWLTAKLEVFKNRRAACANFRAAFAPAIAQIYLARHHGTHDTPVVGNILKDSLVAQASAIEEFRPYVSDSAAYQEAWEQYRKTVRQDNNVIDTAEWGNDAPIWSTVEEKIHAILEFAKT
jgi:hypothetical protein